MTLTEYLQNQLHKENINEGIGDWLKGLIGKDAKATPKQEKAAKTSFGLLGIFASKLGVFGSNDKVGQAFEKIMREQQSEAERRMKDFQESKEGALAAKLEAKWEHKKNQLDLANKKKIAAYNQKKAEFDREIKFWSNNNTSYTEEENNAYDERLEDSFNALGDLKISELEELDALRLKLAYDDDGNPRDLAAIKEYAESEEGKSTFERFNKLARKHNKPMLEGVDDEGFKEVMKKVQVSTKQMDDAKDAQKKADEELKDYNKKAGAVSKINDIKKNLENADTKVTDCKNELNKLTSKYVGEKDASGKTSGLFETDEDNRLKLKSDADIQSAIQAAMDGKFNDGDTDDVKKESIRKTLAGLGIPDSVISNLDTDSTMEFDANKIAEKIKDKLTAEGSGEKLKESILNDANKQCDAARSKLKNAEAVQNRWDEINNCIENGTPVNEMSAEAQEMLSDEQISNIDAYREIPKVDRENGAYDPNNPYGQEVKKRLEKDKSDCDTKVKELNEINEARKAERKMRLKQLEKSNSIPTEVQEKIDKYMQGVDRGETKIFKTEKDENGKEKKKEQVGYYITNAEGKKEFIEKPGIDATKEEKEKYEKGRDKALILNIDENPPFKKVEFLENGKYKIDGREYEDNDEDFAVAAQAEMSLYHQNKELGNAKREEFINSKLGKMINSKDGSFNKEEYDKLTDEEKECVDAMIKDPDKYLGKLANRDAKFDGIKKKLEDEKFQMKYDEYEDTDDEDDEETKELRKSQDDEIDDETESGKDEDGNELVKCEDGKWYKKKEDGTADTDGGPVSSTKAPLKNPAKIWHKKKNKRTGKITKNYHDDNGNSISPEDFKKLVKNYNEKKKKRQEAQKQETQKQETQKQEVNTGESLSNYLKRSII